ncbi:MAG: DUF4342 domain-containing protein [Bacillota bacterium]
MDTTLEKIDAIRKRTHATYRQARQALECSSGDVSDAVRSLRHPWGRTDVLKVRGEDLLRTLATLVRRGNASRIIVRSGNYVVVDLPVTVGVAGAVLAPWVTLFTTLALLVSTWTVEVERPRSSEREPVMP